MNSPLPPTGTAQLLTILDPYVPDAFINEHWNRRPKRGPHRSLSAAQLWRLHLLAVLTPSHSFNQLVALLPEQRGWREFARLAHRLCGPGVRLLNEFRSREGVGGLRAINDSLRLPLIERAAGWSHTVALIDATDLPAACCGFKKGNPALHRAPCRLGRPHPQDRPKPLLCGLQEAYPPVVVA